MVVIHNNFPKWNEDSKTAEPARAWRFDYDQPISSSLFGMCLRHFALRYEKVTGLPEHIIQKIEMLKYDMNIVAKMFQQHVVFKVSWVAVGEYGGVDWPRTYTRCYREMPPDEFFIFAAINGIATKALWSRLDNSEMSYVMNANSDVVRCTAGLMYDPDIFDVAQYYAVLIAAQNGWPGAVCAWIGVQNSTLSNVDYIKELMEDIGGSVFELNDLRQRNNIAKVVLLAIRYKQYHLLRYLPDVSHADAFDILYMEDCLLLNFLHQLINFPVIETLFNNKLSDHLESVARDFLIWLPDVQCLRQMATKIGDIKTIEYINGILNDSKK